MEKPLKEKPTATVIEYKLRTILSQELIIKKEVTNCLNSSFAVSSPISNFFVTKFSASFFLFLFSLMNCS